MSIFCIVFGNSSIPLANNLEGVFFLLSVSVVFCQIGVAFVESNITQCYIAAFTHTHTHNTRDYGVPSSNWYVCHIPPILKTQVKSLKKIRGGKIIRARSYIVFPTLDRESTPLNINMWLPNNDRSWPASANRENSTWSLPKMVNVCWERDDQFLPRRSCSVDYSVSLVYMYRLTTLSWANSLFIQMCIYMHTVYIQTCVYMYNKKKKMNLRGRRPKVMLNAVLMKFSKVR